jgi:hypothetical protein
LATNLPALVSSTNLLQGKLSELEIQVVEKKYASPAIKNLPAPQLLAKVVESIKRIHVITGWVIPEDADYIKILSEELLLKLKEDFSDLNFDEIAFAFRKNGVVVKDWGKAMNLELVVQVLSEYVADRERISGIEERLKSKPVQRIYTQEELDNLHRQDVEAFYQRCLNGVMPPAELPEYYKSILVKDGLLHQESDDLHAFFAYMIERGYEKIYVKEHE